MNISSSTETVSELAKFGAFILANQDEITRRWVTAVDRSPEVAASEDLTYRQILDHLPAICAELAFTLKQPGAPEIRQRIAQDASAHGRKRWQQGYRLDELIREICLIRRNFLDNWLDEFAAKNNSFDTANRNMARRIVERFFDDVIIDSTVQFVDDQKEEVRRIQSELSSVKGAAASDAKSYLLRHVSHTLREPLGAILLAAEALVTEKTLGVDAKDNVRIIIRNAELEAHNIEELVLAAELFNKAGGKQ
ncbi:MAG: RsbRD N-terminal domain-containing protein [Chthoniobacterales bacterium]